MLSRIFGWSLCDMSTYRLAWDMYGGSFCSHPDTLEYLIKNFGIKLNFYQYKRKGELLGCIYVNHLRSLDIGVNACHITFDDIILPISPKLKTWLPACTKHLSYVHHKQFINYTYNPYLNKRSVVIVKDNFSKKTEKKRKNEVSKFLRYDGAIININNFSSNELANIYIDLFNARWGEKAYGCSPEYLSEFLKYFRKNLFGNVLMIKGKPCAYDMIFRSESPEFIYYDDHNGGIDPGWKDVRPGVVLLWENIMAAKKEAKELNKKIRFSLGDSGKNKWEYKELWGNKEFEGKSLIKLF